MAQSTDKSETAKAEAAKAETKKAATTAKTTAKTTAAGTVVYLGPNLPQALLMHGQVFKGGLPKAGQDLLEKAPSAGALFVALADLPKAKKAAKDRTSDISRAYRAVAEATRKG
jgi:hypothetical protein